AAPATAADRTVDHLKAPDLALRLKSMVKPGHKTTLQIRIVTLTAQTPSKKGAIGTPLTINQISHFDQIRKLGEPQEG
ncbi:hypothetical protein AB4099_35055, partial [Bosea sp. 2KB_26]|uniref:hypothetical protein n=1 Tax=Bosea sp. 2KB_26 TaxID=3237475 RepID=UPI003F8DC172